MKVDIEIVVKGQDVVASGSVIAYFRGVASLAFFTDNEWIEIDFLLEHAKDSEEQGTHLSIAPARKFSGQRLQITLTLKRVFGGITTRAPIYIGTANNRMMYVSYSSVLLTQDAAVICYTISLGEQAGG